MVSFSCEACNETMVKKKVQQHLGRCRAAVTCIDCSKTFPGTQFKDHNQCMTEDQKYQGKLYKPKTKPAAPASEPKATAATIKEPAAHNAPKEKQTPAASEPTAAQKRVKVTKPTSLKKVLKKLQKEYKLDKKQLLDELVVGSEGRLTFVSK